LQQFERAVCDVFFSHCIFVTLNVSPRRLPLLNLLKRAQGKLELWDIRNSSQASISRTNTPHFPFNFFRPGDGIHHRALFASLHLNLAVFPQVH
jgi:hypothetical protein